MKKLKFVLLGAGNRGRVYAKLAFAQYDCEIVAIAEPNEKIRNQMRDTYHIPAEMCFKSYEQVLALGKIADLAIIATQDRMHYDGAMKAIELGYDILLEKPVAPTYKECIEICEAAESKGVKVLVCHVLRYRPFSRKIKDIIDSGKIGKIMSVIHLENVRYDLYTAAYVRGPWNNSTESSDMLLAKSCHDIDFLQWLLGSKCKKIQSFGRLSYFTKENCPEGAPKRCIEGCPHSDVCPYNATKFYLEFPDDEGGWLRGNRTLEEMEKSLWEKNEGLCVYQCNNDVVDHQVVNMEFENGETVSFTMATFGQGGRKIHIMGTKGEIISNDFNTIEVFTFCEEDKNSDRFRHNHREIFKAIEEGADQHMTDGHGGGDMGIVNDMYKYFVEDTATKSISTIRTSVENHLLVFAAEESRKNGGVLVDVDEYIERISIT